MTSSDSPPSAFGNGPRGLTAWQLPIEPLSKPPGGARVLERLSADEARRLRSLIAIEQSTLGMPAPERGSVAS